MTIRYDRPVSRAAFLARRLGLFGLVMFVMAAMAHRFGTMTTPSLIALMILSALLGGLAVLLALGGLYALWSEGARGGKAATAALFMAAIPLLPPAFAIMPFFTRPAIHDITTDIDDPPSYLVEPPAEQGWLPARAAVGAQDRMAQKLAYPGLTGRRYDGALDRVLAAVRKVADSQGIVIDRDEGAPAPLFELEAPSGKPEKGVDKDNPDAPVSDSPDVVPVPLPRPEPDLAGNEAFAGKPGEVVIQGHVTSLVFGFRSEVVIRLREEAETTLVDMRITSRYGAHDLGAGDRTIEAYLKALDAELLGIAGD